VNPLRRRLSLVWPVLIARGAFTLWSVVALLTSIWGNASADLHLTGAIIGGTLVGQALGNLIALLRIRLPMVMVGFLVAFIGIAATSGATGAFALWLFLIFLASLSGYLSLGSQFDMVAAFWPLSLSVGAAIVRIQNIGRVSTWTQGNKHGIWDFLSIAYLMGAIFFLLLFLATRQSLALSNWQTNSHQDARQTRLARPGRGSILPVSVLTILILISTSLLSPYLFRAESRDGDRREDKSGEQSPPPEKGGCNKQQQQSYDEEEVPEEPKPPEAAPFDLSILALAFRIFAWLLVFVVVLLILYFAFFPPLRRRLLLRHMRSPLWPVPPTSRVLNLWQRVLATLAILELRPEVGEGPTAFSARATEALAAMLGVRPTTLCDAASLMEKIGYEGRGLAAGDEESMRQHVEQFLSQIEPRIATRQRFLAHWSVPPTIDS